MADNTLVPHVALVESQISPWGKKKSKNIVIFGPKHLGIRAEKLPVSI